MNYRYFKLGHSYIFIVRAKKKEIACQSHFFKNGITP